jgi:hypothetical protein
MEIKGVGMKRQCAFFDRFILLFERFQKIIKICVANMIFVVPTLFYISPCRSLYPSLI